MNLFIGNSNVVQVRGLRNSVTGQYVNGADCSFSVLRNGTAISGGSNVPMSHVPGSNGHYFGVLPETADLNNAIHVVIITVDGGLNQDALWTIPVRPSIRSN